MLGYDIIDTGHCFKWGRIKGRFYVNRRHLDEFKIKFEAYKNRVAY